MTTPSRKYRLEQSDLDDLALIREWLALHPRRRPGGRKRGRRTEIGETDAIRYAIATLARRLRARSARTSPPDGQ